MQQKTAVRGGALLSSLALLALSGSPALGADPVARASASAATVSVAGQTQGTGSYAVTNDGTGERVTGSKTTALPAIGGQTAITFGTASQDARTSLDSSGNGSSQACAGVAGNGATVVSVGNGSTCLSGGDNVSINATTLDLRNITLVDNPALAPLNNALRQILDPVGGALNQATTQLLGALGNPAVRLGLGAVQSSCQADTTSASGTANIANAGAFVDLPAFAGQPAQTLTIASFPASPPPNTKVVTDLDTVVTTILTALRTSLNATATGQLAPLKALIDPLDANLFATIQTQLVDGVLNQVSAQLAPLEANLVNGTLNKQTKASANQIEVTALDLDVLPVAGANSLKLQLGTSSCGPNGTVVAPAVATSPTPTRSPEPRTPNKRTPVVPTSVPAGLASSPADGQPLDPWAVAGLGGLLAVSVAAGTASYRRSRSGA